jgi:hypothetical protein
MQYLTNTFAQVYGACSYGGSGYQNNICQTSASGGGSTSSSSAGGGLLTNTGFDILLVTTLACTIIFAALIVRFWKRPKKQSKTATQP